jgi:hypothetical protein
LDGILEGDDSNRIESEMLKENNYYFSHDNKTLA